MATAVNIFGGTHYLASGTNPGKVKYSPEQMPSKAYLDVDIGCRQTYEAQAAAYKLASDWNEAMGSKFGLGGGPVESLDEELQQLLLESIASDPAWASRGEASCKKPFQIRAGRVVVELYDEQVPKTTANFKALCTGEKGLGKASKKPLHFRGNKFHRIIKDFMVQGGDVVRGDGSGGDSIYNGTFNDEKKGLSLKHDARGVLSMANSGKNTNTSQFFLTLAPAPHLDGKHVVFGCVCEGLDVLERINEEAASAEGTPRCDVVIADCGIL